MDLDALLPASLAARRAGVSKQVFNYWRKSGKIQAAGMDRDGRPLYRHLDVLFAERETRHSSRSYRASRKSYAAAPLS